MVDTIIVLIVIVLLVFALKGSLKHFRGEGTCCGGSGTGKPARTENPGRTGGRPENNQNFRYALSELC